MKGFLEGEMKGKNLSMNRRTREGFFEKKRPKKGRSFAL